MGIVQETIFKVARNLGATIHPEIDDWGTAETKINEKLEERRRHAETVRKGDPISWSEWKKTEAAYAELISDLNAAKKATRHRTAHYRERYNEVQADKALRKVEDFVRHAATLLPDTVETQSHN
jgi:hypothetical protein